MLYKSIKCILFRKFKTLSLWLIRLFRLNINCSFPPPLHFPFMVYFICPQHDFQVRNYFYLLYALSLPLFKWPFLLSTVSFFISQYSWKVSCVNLVISFFQEPYQDAVIAFLCYQWQRYRNRPRLQMVQN